MNLFEQDQNLKSKVQSGHGSQSELNSQLIEKGLNMSIQVQRVITIDGPAASGKTSVSRELAKRLNWSWVSTGSFYRGLAYVANQKKCDFNNENELSALAISDCWSVKMGRDLTHVFFDGKDVTELITHDSVGSIASKISHFPKVRLALLEPQRACLKLANGLVAEGRDCGTVVFPNALAKVYLTASSENRATRRAMELGLSASETEQSQSVRDQQDAQRKVAPLQVPEKAILIDSSELNLDQVVEKVHQSVAKLI